MKYEICVTGSFDGAERPSFSFSVEANDNPTLKAKVKKGIVDELCFAGATDFNGNVTVTRVEKTVIRDATPVELSIEPRVNTIRDL